MTETFSIYTTGDVLAFTGPDGKSYADVQAAQRDANARSDRATAMDLKVRYKVGPGKSASK